MAKPVTTNQQPAASGTNTMAVIGFILAFLIPPLGLIFCIIALVQAKKRGQGGKGLAIAGILISIIELLLTIAVIAIVVFAAASTNLKLVTYSNNQVGYSVEYPDKWVMESSNTSDAQSVIFKDPVKNTGLVKGQVEVVYVPPPAHGYSADVLNAIRDGLKQQNKDFVITNETRQPFNRLDSLRIVGTYDGENGQIKMLATIILNKDNSVYTVVTQAPAENWDKLQDEFNTIHNTFQP